MGDWRFVIGKSLLLRFVFGDRCSAASVEREWWWVAVSCDWLRAAGEFRAVVLLELLLVSVRWRWKQGRCVLVVLWCRVR